MVLFWYSTVWHVHLAPSCLEGRWIERPSRCSPLRCWSCFGPPWGTSWASTRLRAERAGPWSFSTWAPALQSVAEWDQGLPLLFESFIYFPGWCCVAWLRQHKVLCRLTLLIGALALFLVVAWLKFIAARLAWRNVFVHLSAQP